MRASAGLLYVFLFFSFGMPGPLRLAAQVSGANSALQNYQIGRDLEAQSRLSEAEVYYNTAIRICQDEVSRNTANGETYAVITWALRRQNKYADVISWGERGIGIFSDEYRIIETMGEAYFHLGDYSRSLTFMQRYVNVLPQGGRSSVAFFYIGEIYRLTQRFRHADIAYTTAVRLDSGNALWWYRLATVRESAGDTSPAIEAYQQALKLNPAYREASEGLTRLQSR